MDELSEDDKLTVARARKIMRFLSQPFQVAEVFTGKEGKLVDLQVSGCGQGCGLVFNSVFGISLCLPIPSAPSLPLLSPFLLPSLPWLFYPSLPLPPSSVQSTISGFKRIIDGKSVLIISGCGSILLMYR